MQLSIIIVNFNTTEITCNCIQSIIEHTKGISYEIILVDNSPKKTETFKQRFPEINYLSTQENRGFGAANNLALKHSKGKEVLFLNPDTLLIEDTCTKVSTFINSSFADENNIVAVGCRLLNPDYSFQHSYYYFKQESLYRAFLLSNLITLKLKSKKGLIQPILQNKNEVGDISGAFMYIKKKSIDKTKGFDEDFFMYAEDTEWCRNRLIKEGRIYYYPETSIIHLGGQSAPRKDLYTQLQLSIAVYWRKRGLASYLGYIFISKINFVTNVSLFFFLKDISRKQAESMIKSFIRLIPYYFKLLFISTSYSSNRNQFIYEPLKKNIFGIK